MAGYGAAHRSATTGLLQLPDYRKDFRYHEADSSLYGPRHQNHGRFTGNPMFAKRHDGVAANTAHRGFHRGDFDRQNDFKQPLFQRECLGQRTNWARRWRPSSERAGCCCPCKGASYLRQNPSWPSDQQATFFAIITYPVYLLLLNRVSLTLSRVLFMCAASLYPAYICCKAFRSGKSRLLRSWTRYWILLAAFLSVEPLLDVIIDPGLPLYAELKLSVIFWMQTSGTGLVFQRFVLPGFDKLQREVDTKVAFLQDRAAKMRRTIWKRAFTPILNSLQYIREFCNSVDGKPSIDKMDTSDEDDEYSFTGNTWECEDW